MPGSRTYGFVHNNIVIEPTPPATPVPTCPVVLSPVDGAILGAGEDSIIVTWGTLFGITTYNVYVWIEGDVQPTAPTEVVVGTQMTASPLTLDVDYNILVTAVNGNGQSTGCNITTVSTVS